MNTFSASTLDLSMETGSGPLSDMEAQKFTVILVDELPRTQPCDQHVILDLIRGLRELPKPEAAFGDLYQMPGALPGWIPDR